MRKGPSSAAVWRPPPAAFAGVPLAAGRPVRRDRGHLATGARPGTRSPPGWSAAPPAARTAGRTSERYPRRWRPARPGSGARLGQLGDFRQQGVERGLGLAGVGSATPLRRLGGAVAAAAPPVCGSRTGGLSGAGSVAAATSAPASSGASGSGDLLDRRERLLGRRQQPLELLAGAASLSSSRTSPPSASSCQALVRRELDRGRRRLDQRRLADRRSLRRHARRPARRSHRRRRTPRRSAARPGADAAGAGAGARRVASPARCGGLGRQRRRMASDRARQHLMAANAKGGGKSERSPSASPQTSSSIGRRRSARDHWPARPAPRQSSPGGPGSAPAHRRRRKRSSGRSLP